MSAQHKRNTYKWFITGLVALAVIAYASGCAYMWVNQKYYIFMPQREISQTPADHDLAFDDLYLPVSSANNGGIERMHCWWIDGGGGFYIDRRYGPAGQIISLAANWFNHASAL